MRKTDEKEFVDTRCRLFYTCGEKLGVEPVVRDNVVSVTHSVSNIWLQHPPTQWQAGLDNSTLLLMKEQGQGICEYVGKL